MYMEFCAWYRIFQICLKAFTLHSVLNTKLWSQINTLYKFFQYFHILFLFSVFNNACFNAIFYYKCYNAALTRLGIVVCRFYNSSEIPLCQVAIIMLASASAFFQLTAALKRPSSFQLGLDRGYYPAIRLGKYWFFLEVLLPATNKT